MSEAGHPPSSLGDEPSEATPEREDPPEGDLASQGTNLLLLYGLLALALAAAIGFALLIVLPFYHRR
jgi:uncharacterized protein HemX